MNLQVENFQGCKQTGQSLYDSCYTILLYLFKVLYYKVKHAFFIFIFVWLLCIICVKSIINLLQYYGANCIILVPELTVKLKDACSLEEKLWYT